MNFAEMVVERAFKIRKRIVVIGDAMIDYWVYGNKSSCQEGCFKVCTESTVNIYGGAANAFESLKYWPINKNLQTYPEDLWPIKYRFATSDEINFRWDDEVEVNTANRDSFLWKYYTQLALDMAECADGVLLSDYNKGFLTEEVIERIVGSCKRRNIPCVADCKREPSFYKGCLLKCNNDYYCKYYNQILNMQVPLLVVTNGCAVPLIREHNTLINPKSHPVKVKCENFIGAGDCFSAHFVLGLVYDLTIEESAMFAHSAGRVYVQKKHNSPPHYSHICEDMANWGIGNAAPRTAAGMA